MSEPFIVHCHIPGTDGSVLNRRLLFPMYGEDCTYRMYDRAFEATSQLSRQHIARAMRCFVAVGHIPFGYFDEVYPDATYVSIFREPTARFLADINHALTDPNHSLRDQLPDISNNAPKDRDSVLGAILNNPKSLALFANAQTRLASGVPRFASATITADHLDAAVQNMARKRYITGTQEDLAALFKQLTEAFPNARMKNDAPETQSDSPNPVTVEHLNLRTLDQVRAANDLDLRLYATLHETPVKEIAHAA